MTERQRADLVLVQRGVFESRKRAQDAIAAGLVRANGRPVRKPSEVIETDAAIEAEAAHPWVSRGGTKLAAALDHFDFDPKGKICLDVGASTGGFTDVLLARGAVTVHAIDVGHGQLHAKLASDARVHAREGTDIRNLARRDFNLAPQFVACDVSFISLTAVLPAIAGLAAETAEFVCLVKPQFEAGREHVDKGLVRDPAVHAAVCRRISSAIGEFGCQVLGIIPSPIAGGDGNREFLLGARRP